MPKNSLEKLMCDNPWLSQILQKGSSDISQKSFKKKEIQKHGQIVQEVPVLACSAKLKYLSLGK